MEKKRFQVGSSEIMTQFLHYMTSSFHIVDLKGNIFGHAINPLNFIVIALIFYEMTGRGKREGLKSPSHRSQKTKKARYE